LTPCGGTHASHTGEIGLIAVRSWERAKGLTRIEWVAGHRALEDYRRANKSVRSVAALFSTARDDAPKLAARMLEENKQLNHRLRPLEEIALRAEAEQLYATASVTAAGLRVITKVFEQRDAESLRLIAQALINRSKVVALLGSADEDTARMVFAR